MTHRGIDFESAALPIVGDLYRTAFRMVHDEHAAERFVEGTFAEARREFHDLRDADAIRRRLFTVLFRKLHKRRRTWLDIKALLTGNIDTPGDYCDPDEMLRELDRIPGILREVILLVDVEGFNKRETAEILETSPELVAMRLAEARTRFRVAFREEPSLA
jgi:RNA polymerase sigma-70 factor (ECF subfamily)